LHRALGAHEPFARSRSRTSANVQAAVLSETLVDADMITHLISPKAGTEHRAHYPVIVPE